MPSRNKSKRRSLLLPSQPIYSRERSRNKKYSFDKMLRTTFKPVIGGIESNIYKKSKTLKKLNKLKNRAEELYNDRIRLHTPPENVWLEDYIYTPKNRHVRHLDKKMAKNMRRISRNPTASNLASEIASEKAELARVMNMANRATYENALSTMPTFSNPNPLQLPARALNNIAGFLNDA